MTAAAARAAKIVDAPAAVTAISEVQIEREAAHGQVPKILEFTPGGMFLKRKRPSASVISICLSSLISTLTATTPSPSLTTRPTIRPGCWAAASRQKTADSATTASLQTLIIAGISCFFPEFG